MPTAPSTRHSQSRGRVGWGWQTPCPRSEIFPVQRVMRYILSTLGMLHWSPHACDSELRFRALLGRHRRRCSLKCFRTCTHHMYLHLHLHLRAHEHHRVLHQGARMHRLRRCSQENCPHPHDPLTRFPPKHTACKRLTTTQTQVAVLHPKGGSLIGCSATWAAQAAEQQVQWTSHTPSCHVGCKGACSPSRLGTSRKAL